MVHLGDYAINKNSSAIFRDSHEVDVTVTRIVRHPDHHIDVAILIIDCQPALGPHINTILISPTSSAHHSSVIIAGWGKTSAQSWMPSDILQKITLDVDSVETCNMGSGFVVREHHFCAGMIGSDVNMNICQGDSGSGAIYRTKTGRPYLIGVVQRGARSCSDVEPYAVITETSTILDWIYRIIAGTVNICEKQDTHRDNVTLFSEAPGEDECFPGSSIVVLENGHIRVPISSLIPGDRVLAMSTTGDPMFTDFIGFMHMDMSLKTDFLSIQTDTSVLKISRNHLLMVFQDEDQSVGVYDFARNVRVGHYVLNRIHEGNFRKSLVTSLSYSEAMGVFAPLTQEGTIVVDDVVASCYATVPSHYFGHLGTWPYRIWKQYIHPGSFEGDMPMYIRLLRDFILPLLISISSS